MRCAIVIESAEGDYSAYVPDLPGCVATGATIAEVEAEIREAIAFHVAGLLEDWLPVPPGVRSQCRQLNAVIAGLTRNPWIPGQARDDNPNSVRMNIEAHR